MPDPSPDLDPGESMRIAPVAAPVRSQVLERLRGAIINRRFEPGQRLIERELCELTGASRTPVREALRQLESEGLIEMIPNRGPVVAVVTPEEAEEIYDVRGALEALAARRFAERATPKEIEALGEAVTGIGQAVDAGLTDLLELKDQFYRVLLEGAGNQMITSMLDPLRTRVRYLRVSSLSQPGRPSASVEELRAVVAAIRRGDPEEAQACALQHIERATEAALGTIVEAQPGDGPRPRQDRGPAARSSTSPSTNR